MTRSFLLSMLLVGVCVYTSCDDGPDFDETPRLFNPRLSVDTMDQGPEQCIGNFPNLFFSFDIEDGDGDFKSSANNVYIWDSRLPGVGTFEEPAIITLVSLPDILPLGNSSGIKATATINLTDDCHCCRLGTGDLCAPLGIGIYDSLHFVVMVEDAAGNRSNLLESPVLYLHCN